MPLKKKDEKKQSEPAPEVVASTTQPEVADDQETLLEHPDQMTAGWYHMSQIPAKSRKLPVLISKTFDEPEEAMAWFEKMKTQGHLLKGEEYRLLGTIKVETV